MAKAGLVPIVDFKGFLVGTAEEKLATANELLTAMKDVGFVMLSNFYDSAVTKEKVEKAFSMTKEFFSLPIDTKDGLAWQSPESNRGYVRQGRERVTQAKTKEEVEALRAAAPDFKETMEIGEDANTVSPWPNMWPKDEECPGFKAFMNDFFNDCHELHLEIMRALALAMNLGEGWFDDKVNEKAHNLRLLNYPSVESSLIANGGNRAGSHSDYGTVTLLFQDMVGGLEVQDKKGDFIPARPVHDTVVVNCGDLLQQWSNDVLKSTIHRVVLPTESRAPSPTGSGPAMTPQRNSIAFFSNPNLHQVIECIPGTGEAKYEPVESETYLVRRLTATYS
ncbi:thymine dioxygenase [Meredithblackwellia eburnea MCA 4105]